MQEEPYAFFFSKYAIQFPTPSVYRFSCPENESILPPNVYYTHEASSFFIKKLPHIMQGSLYNIFILLSDSQFELLKFSGRIHFFNLGSKASQFYFKVFITAFNITNIVYRSISFCYKPCKNKGRSGS